MQLNKESLADQIRKELKNRIINVEIEQGEKINVSSLEEEFGVSRAPVREALQSLVDQGLVEVKPRVGYFAIDLTPKQIKDLCELRELLEVYALKESLHNIPSSELELLKQETLELKKNHHSQDELRRKFDNTDEKLHTAIIQNSQNEFLKSFAKRIHNLIALTRHLNERIEEAIEEHINLLRAMLDENRKKAESVLEEHLENVKKETLKRNKKVKRGNYTEDSLN